MSCPIFCIKTNNALDDSLALVNQSGVGNAIPTVSVFNDLDERFNFSGGDVGKLPVRLQHELTLSMDEVPSNIREQLLDWKFRRVPVTLCDSKAGWPITENTIYKILPSNQPAGTVFSDLTGRVNMIGVFDSLKYLWNKRLQMLSSRVDNEMIVEETVRGNAWRFHSQRGTLSDPSFPMSSTSGFGIGKAGWEITPGGCNVDLVQGVFPTSTGQHDDVLHFTTNADGQCTLVIPPPQLPYSGGAGGGFLEFSFWVKGKLGNKAAANIINVGPAVTVTLSGKNYSGWEKVILRAYTDDLSTIAGQMVLFTFNSAVGDDVDFYLGPQMACFFYGEDRTGPAHWVASKDDVIASSGYIESTDDIPDSSHYACTISFIIPEELDLWNSESYFIGLAAFGGLDVGRVHLNRYNNGTRTITFSAVNPYTYHLTDGDEHLFKPGYHVWSFIADPGSLIFHFVANGKLIDSPSIQVQALHDGKMRFGHSIEHASSSIYFLCLRADDGRFTPDEIIAGHNLMLNTVSRGTYELAKGRWYEIVSVPQTPLIQEGDAIYMGDLVLRQIQYDQGQAVWYADEESGL